MSKISKIIQREYITRVRKKSFIIMTILGPILFAALMVAPMLMSKFDDGTERKVAVVDSSSIYDY
ncbi:MAG: ABC transporter permease, partial [Salinivirgaceae bacterium]|nr:ABC transporter permease [Salinivirgaceae bacterium]